MESEHEAEERSTIRFRPHVSGRAKTQPRRYGVSADLSKFHVELARTGINQQWIGGQTEKNVAVSSAGS